MKIIYPTNDGMAIIHPTPEALIHMTIEDIAKKDVPTVLLASDKFGNAIYEQLPYEIVEDDAIPSDRTFRNAWGFDKANKKVNVNIPKAQEITKNRLRAERKPKLEELDVEVMRNITDPVKLAEIEARKQVLRDVTKVVDTLTTVEELKAVTV